jgi:acyl-CoA synthetase (AMP-forming)/AMP-acid ligase II
MQTRDFLVETGDCSNLVQLLQAKATVTGKFPGYTFVVNGDTESSKLTYLELDMQAKAIASHLQSLGMSDRRALLLYPPGLEFISAFFGCLYAKFVAVPAYPPRPNQSAERLQAVITDADAALGLTTSSLLPTLERYWATNPQLPPIEWITTDKLDLQLANSWQMPEIASHTLAFLQYTSGSTGKPKGVMVSHGNLIHNLSQIYAAFGHHSQSQGVIWLPPYHDMGLIGGVLQPLYGGFPVALMSPMDFLQQPISWLKAISKFRGTTSGGPNFAYDLCVNKITPAQLQTLDLSSWEVAFNGAEPISSETIAKFAAKFAPCGFRRSTFYPCYGMAEATLIVAGGDKQAEPVIYSIEKAALAVNRALKVLEPGIEDKTVVGCGYARSHQQIIIVNPNTLAVCLPGEVGEIWVAGESIAQGYWKDREKTLETFNACLNTGQGPFLRTGDLGFIDDGELFITGRIKDVIIIRGRNHYPQDIERTVELSHPAFRHGCGSAFGVEIADKEQLVVIQEVERSAARNLDIDTAIANIHQEVAIHHGLQVYATFLLKTGSLPKTSSGKVQRHLCRTKFLDGSLDALAIGNKTRKIKAA